MEATFDGEHGQMLMQTQAKATAEALGDIQPTNNSITDDAREPMPIEDAAGSEEDEDREDKEKKQKKKLSAEEIKQALEDFRAAKKSRDKKQNELQKRKAEYEKNKEMPEFKAKAWLTTFGAKINLQNAALVDLLEPDCTVRDGLKREMEEQIKEHVVCINDCKQPLKKALANPKDKGLIAQLKKAKTEVDDVSQTLKTVRQMIGKKKG